MLAWKRRWIFLILMSIYFHTFLNNWIVRERVSGLHFIVFLFFLYLSSLPRLLTPMEFLFLGFVYLLLTSLLSYSSVWFSKYSLTRKVLKYVSLGIFSLVCDLFLICLAFPLLYVTGIESFKIILFFNWSIVDLQNHISFRCTEKWFHHIYIIFSIIGY